MDSIEDEKGTPKAGTKNLHTSEKNTLKYLIEIESGRHATFIVGKGLLDINHTIPNDESV